MDAGNTTKNIAVIGVGNIGFRRLQSLVTLPSDQYSQYSIFALEPVEERRTFLSKEFQNVPNLTILKDIAELPPVIDLAVIATSSNVRKAVFQELIEHSTVKNIIFEKVLFQKVSDYYYVKDRLRSLNIKAWVNTARREAVPYQELRDALRSCREFIFTTIGGQWGMGCNSVHVLDLIEFLSGSPVDEGSLSISNLESGIVPSKRSGFYEFFGTITGRAGKCKHFSITCMNNSTLPSLKEITTEDTRYVIDEGNGKIRIEKQGEGVVTKDFKLPYISQITSKIATEIFETGTCYLPDYEASMETHLKFIKPLFGFFKENGFSSAAENNTTESMENEICPIT